MSAWNQVLPKGFSGLQGDLSFFVCLSFCLCLSLSLSVYHCLSMSVFACLPTCLPACLSVCLSLSLSVSVSVSLPPPPSLSLSLTHSLSLSVCLSVSFSLFLSLPSLSLPPSLPPPSSLSSERKQVLPKSLPGRQGACTWISFVLAPCIARQRRGVARAAAAVSKYAVCVACARYGLTSCGRAAPVGVQSAVPDL